MELRALKTIAFSGILLLICVGCFARRNWEVEILSINGTSSDESKLNISVRVQRVGRNERGMSGFMDWKFDSDENTMIETSIFTSNSGSEADYSEIPYKFPIMKFHDCIDKYYFDFIYKDFGPCSNLPSFSGKFEPPYPKNNYTFDRCVPNAGSFPDYMLPAYYKFHLKLTGPVELNIILYSRITSKLL